MDSDNLILAAVGDCQMTTKHSPCKDRRFLELIEILRSADVTYMNMEQCIHHMGPNCYPARISGGSYTHSPPFVADEIKWMGVDMVSLPTNHSLDWMFGGLKETIDNLDRVGIAHAGTGMNLAEARAPCFFDSEKGRVALISVDTSNYQYEAGDARRDAPGRPGNSTLKISKIITLDPKTFEAMRQVAYTLRSLGFLEWSKRAREREAERQRPGALRTRELIPADAKEFDLRFPRRGYGVARELAKFVLGDKPGVISVPDENDVKEVMQMISDARRQAEWVFVSQHHHVVDGLDRDLPSKAVEEFAHICLDEGADAYIGTGPHRIQGIEIYEGKPIFYSLPDIIQQHDMGKAPPQEYYKRYGLGFTNTPMDAMNARGGLVTAPPRGSGIVVCTFQKHSVVDIKIYPVDPQAELPRWKAGRPLRADEALSRKIVEHWAKLSETYGTKIDYEKGIGIIRLL